MWPVQDSGIRVSPLLFQDQLIQDGYVPDIRDGGYDDAFPAQLALQPGQHLIRIDQVLKNIVSDDAIKVVVRQVVDQNVHISVENLVGLAFCLFGSVRIGFNSPYLGLQCFLQLLGKKAFPATPAIRPAFAPPGTYRRRTAAIREPPTTSSSWDAGPLPGGQKEPLRPFGRPGASLSGRSALPGSAPPYSGTRRSCRPTRPTTRNASSSPRRGKPSSCPAG